jgi:hypothetical protein
MAGRRRKDTDQTLDRLCQGLSLGATHELACRYAGVASSTFRAWRQEAERAAPGTRQHALLARLDAAEGQAAVHWLRLIEDAAQQGQWQAAAWKLERRYPSEYGRHIVQHDGQVRLTTQPEWITLRQAILSALAEFPEARVALAEVLTPEQDHRNGQGSDARQ